MTTNRLLTTVVQLLLAGVTISLVIAVIQEIKLNLRISEYEEDEMSK